MASICRSIVTFSSTKNVLYTSYRFAAKVTMGDPLEHATGICKRELLAKVAGNANPFDYKLIKRGAGLKKCPTEIPSACDRRLVGCICHDYSTSISYMWLHKGVPKRCECGHWYKLVFKKPV